MTLHAHVILVLCLLLADVLNHQTRLVVVRVLNRRIQIVVFVFKVRVHRYVARVGKRCQQCIRIIYLYHTVVRLVLREAEITHALDLGLLIWLFVLNRLVQTPRRVVGILSGVD